MESGWDGVEKCKLADRRCRLAPLCETTTGPITAVTPHSRIGLRRTCVGLDEIEVHRFRLYVISRFRVRIQVPDATMYSLPRLETIVRSFYMQAVLHVKTGLKTGL